MSRTSVGNNTVDHSDVGAARSNYIFILDLTSGFNGFGKDNCKMRRESFKFWDFVRLIIYFTGMYIMAARGT